MFKGAYDRYAITPSWSPDGSMIMFGSGLTQIIGGIDFKREPVWVSR